MSRDDEFARWYRTHHPRIRRLCARILRDHAAAEDMAQEALLRAWQRHDQMRDQDLGAWLSVVARNLCLSALRRDGRIIPTETLPERADLGADPALEIGRRESRRNVRRALGKLGDRQRRVIHLSEIHEVDYQEIGSELGLTAEGARTIAFRARRALREHLAAVGEGLSGVLVGIRIRVRDLRMRARESARVIDAGSGPALHVGMNVALAVGVSLATIGGAVSFGRTSGRPPSTIAVWRAPAPVIAPMPSPLDEPQQAAAQHPARIAGHSPAGTLGLPKPELHGTPYNYEDGSSNMLFRYGPIAIESEDHRGSPGHSEDGFEPVYRPIDAAFAALCTSAPSACVPLEGEPE